MSQLIIVSNRVAVPTAETSGSAGGLAVAVTAALKRRRGLWFGWSGAVSKDPAPTPSADVPSTVYHPTVHHHHNRTFVTLDLSEADFQEYYNGFANRVLWPIFHYRVDLADFTAVDFSGYLRVNGVFARALSTFIAPDDLIWVHDYHLLPLARELRALGHQNRIGFFLHIPCPPPDLLEALPQHAETVGTLDHYDLVGVQTDQDAANIGRYLERDGVRMTPLSHSDLSHSDLLNESRMIFGDSTNNHPAPANRAGSTPDGTSGARRTVRVGAFPVGIETAAYARAARTAAGHQMVRDLHLSLANRALILGVDRLDYTKGIPHRIRAFGQFLDQHPEWVGTVTLLQITPKSRVDVPEYIDIDRDLGTLIGQVNGRHGDAAWTPVRYVNRAYPRTILAGFYRLARVGLVTPLRDGMNLVAKEYVAAQDPDDPGVLILSQFAGAAEKLDGAILVNPHETDAMVAALHCALTLSLDERRDRHRRMMAYLVDHDIHDWAGTFLAALAAGEKDRESG